MIGVDIKALIEKCNAFCTQTLHSAAGLTINRGHYEVTLEHFILAALEDTSSDIPLIMHHFGADISALKTALNRSLEDFPSGNPSRPVFSPLLQEILEAAWLITSVDLKLPFLRSGTILFAFLRRPSLYAQGQYSALLSIINRDDLLAQLPKIFTASTEDSGMTTTSSTNKSTNFVADTSESFIAKFCEDYTAKAAKGGMDPVFGRDIEIRRMIDILGRRRKNNPILVGEAGVGKTAVVEGLALRIIQGDVPSTLKGVRLLSLDMGLLEAGASMKGEFERRLKGILDEIKASPSPIILFIDEAHLLVGAGNSAGGSDAANLMKPALARGEIRTCAATTWKEYKKYFEKDPALTRRFQLVSLDEPSVQTTALILRGLKDNYERHHNVLIRDDAIEVAANYASRYITGRFLPDKAVDLLDTACARIKVGLAAKPAHLEDSERAIQALERELKSLERDHYNGIDLCADRKGYMDTLSTHISSKTKEAEELYLAWQKELACVQSVLDARQDLRNAREAEIDANNSHFYADSIVLENSNNVDSTLLENSNDVDSMIVETSTNSDISTSCTAESEHSNSINSVENIEEITNSQIGKNDKDANSTILSVQDALDKLATSREALSLLQNENPLVFYEVSPESIGQIVSDWTGIPVGKMAQDQASMMKELDAILSQRIKGQEVAINAVVEGIQASKAGLRSIEQPLAVFLLVGPSGVGKTETGLALAEALFGDENSIVNINMSEFQEKHTVSRLIGSPPGYIGYGEGGLLTEAVRRRPYSVVLLDEVEKAHLDVMQLFYQVFDKGILTDGEGVQVSFKNTVILLTSNLATDIIQNLCQEEAPTSQVLLDSIRPTLSKHFQAALLARMNIVPYASLQTNALANIADLKLEALAKRLYSNNKITLTWCDTVSQTLAARCSEVETGARNIDSILSSTILPQMSKKILGHMVDGNMPSQLRLEFNEEGSLCMRFS